MTTRVRLGVNIDHVATLRNARGTPYPDPVEAARTCLDAGAHGGRVEVEPSTALRDYPQYHPL